MHENEISYKVRGAIFKVYNKIGPGLFESVYEKALVLELTREGLKVEEQVPLPFVYDTIKMDLGFRMDLLVENLVVVEVKSVESVSEIFHKQLLTYLVLSKKKLGLLVNFNTVDIDKSIIRKVNGL
jgi:GxxExxY protein